MTISRYKNAQDINKIGHELEKEFTPVKWLDADFKKNDGYEHSLLLIKEHEMYFQEYCGCIYSYNVYMEKKGKKLEYIEQYLTMVLVIHYNVFNINKRTFL